MKENEENKNSTFPETDDMKEKDDTHEMADDVSFEEVNEEGDEPDLKTKIKKLKDKIKELEKEKETNLNGWTRAKADYVNFKREVEERRQDDIRFASKKLIMNILPALDSYTFARSNKEAWEKVDSNWRTGIEYIFGQLESALKKEGLEEFGKVGDTFDPKLHESVEIVKVENKNDDDKVVAVLQKGYMLNGQVIREAKVKTGEYTN